jgi:hypothetical protein
MENSDLYDACILLKAVVYLCASVVVNADSDKKLGTRVKKALLTNEGERGAKGIKFRRSNPYSGL